MKGQSHSGVGQVQWYLFGILIAIAVISACRTESRGFILPDGDVEQGRQLFTEMSCNHCHSITDISWQGNEEEGDPHIKLGGEVTLMKTYGELVTSVINPSHKISRRSLNTEEVTLPEGASKMESYRYNEIMTVDELIDIVTYLQTQYDLRMPEYTYPYGAY